MSIVEFWEVQVIYNGDWVRWCFCKTIAESQHSADSLRALDYEARFVLVARVDV